MQLEDVRNISVMGAGLMGHGIAQSFLMGGYPVKLYDVADSILEIGRTRIKDSLHLFSQAGLIETRDIEDALQRLTLTAELDVAVEGADFITEAAPEDLALKQELFSRIEERCGDHTIIASNTSSLTLTDIGLQVKQKERLVTTHWFNPPQLVPTVEVVKGEKTSDETMDIAYDLLSKIRKVPVKLNRELPGFLINRLQMALAREILDLYEKGVASAEDIDKAVMGSIGFRLASIGPLLTMDLAGIGLWYNVANNLMPKLQSSTEAPKALKRLVDQGHDGIKSGKGFYDYGAAFSQGGVNETAQKRDREFLQRLKNLYWNE
jgi:3-hydroxyacyl-CoA dehydrogenase